MGPTRSNIGAIIMIEPPPLLAYHSKSGRKRVISRYTESLESPTKYRYRVLFLRRKKSALYYDTILLTFLFTKLFKILFDNFCYFLY